MSLFGTVVPLGDGISDYEDDGEIEVNGDQSEPHLGPEATSWCNSCRVYSERLHCCTKCSRRICGASGPGMSGCIRSDSITDRDDFICPDHKLKDDNLGYLTQRYLSANAHNKLLWPLAIVTLSLKSPQNEYYATSRIALDMGHEYRTVPCNLSLTHLKIQDSAQKVQRQNLEPAIKFLKQTVSLGFPANTVIFINTHFCVNTGSLQYASDRTNSKVVDIHSPVSGFIGQSFLDAMAEASKVGRSMLKKGPVYPEHPGLRITNPGGLKVLVLMSCGPCMTNDNHMLVFKKDVNDDRYDLILGFTGNTILPEFVINEMIDIIRHLTVNQERDIWCAIGKGLKHAERLLRHTAVMVIFKEGDSLCCRQIGLHDPPSRVLGLDFACGSMTCRSLAGELRYSTKPHSDMNKETVRQDCRRCNFRSKNIKLAEIDWLRRVGGAKRIFWHEYPPTLDMMTLFRQNEAMGGDQKGKRDRAPTVSMGQGGKKRKVQ